MVEEKVDITEDIYNFFKSLVRNKLMGAPTPSTYWYEQIGAKPFNKIIYLLRDFVESKVYTNRNWAELSLKQDINPRLVKNYKTELYKLDKWIQHSNPDIVKTEVGICKTGLVREGFNKATRFYYKFDTKYLREYIDFVKENAVKAMQDVNEINFNGLDYKSIVEDLIDLYANTDEKYTLGKLRLDSRGRAIYSCTEKVFNPITNKFARSLLLFDDKIDINKQPLRARINLTQRVFLAIAELNGERKSTRANKLEFGKKLYSERILPEVDNVDDVYEIIWTKRLYDELDRYYNRDKNKPFYWRVPIEIDATASLSQIAGALLNDKKVLMETNVIGNRIRDFWTIDGVPRKAVKKSLTPILYGSTKSPFSLLKAGGIEVTKEQLKLISHELRYGKYKTISNFKDYVLKYVEPEPEMNVVINGEEFTVYCNRFNIVGEYSKKYFIYDTEEERVKMVFNTATKRVPNLKVFKRYFQTLLIHNLDSQVANHICNEVISDEVSMIPIHDAFVVNPLLANKVEELYFRELMKINLNRVKILVNYFKSIGIERISMDFISGEPVIEQCNLPLK
jgi:hypothetical protein